MWERPQPDRKDGSPWLYRRSRGRSAGARKRADRCACLSCQVRSTADLPKSQYCDEFSPAQHTGERNTCVCTRDNYYCFQAWSTKRPRMVVLFPSLVVSFPSLPRRFPCVVGLFPCAVASLARELHHFERRTNRRGGAAWLRLVFGRAEARPSVAGLPRVLDNRRSWSTATPARIRFPLAAGRDRERVDRVEWGRRRFRPSQGQFP
ncbi:MAG: hypothetical protein PCFJNLEI_01978 [Verrucomicrobiae bacterium]|nr:hypothetical protein [Verrucomicrobiae bacterium]